jgi:two-component system, NarL family, response regulator NreC
MLNASVQPQISILLVDDHPVVRLGLIQLLHLEPDLRVRWQAASIDEAVAVCESDEPDMAIVDISLGDESGVELIKMLTRRRPSMQILAMSMHDESLYAERALRAGAKGYVMKHSAAKNIVAALRRIRKGGIHVSEEMRSHLAAGAIAGNPEKRTSGLGQLSDRELEVLRLIGLGLKKSEIALRLKLSVNTIETHRGSLKKKLNVNSTCELVRLAILHFERDRKP